MRLGHPNCCLVRVAHGRGSELRDGRERHGAAVGAVLAGASVLMACLNVGAELRKFWRAHWAEHDRIREANEAASDGDSANVLGGRRAPRIAYPPFPDALRGMICGARTRKGTPCQRLDLYRSGRCKLHGGLSTGPRSVDGKERAADNLRLRWSEPHERLRKVNIGADLRTSGANHQGEDRCSRDEVLEGS